MIKNNGRKKKKKMVISGDKRINIVVVVSFFTYLICGKAKDQSKSIYRLYSRVVDYYYFFHNLEGDNRILL